MKELRFLKAMFVMLLVMFASNAWGEYVEVSNFTAISGDLNSYISYEAAQGEAATAPGVYSNQIRVYQNGGTFTVRTQEGCVITVIELGSSSTTSVSFSVDNGTESSNRRIVANQTEIFSDLSCSNNVKFTCKGTDKNSRLNINYLKVTYSLGQVPAHTAQFSINGNINPEDNCTVAENTSIYFPSPDDIDDYKFMGWTKSKDYSDANLPPTDLCTTALMGTTDITYYAVFAIRSGSAPTETKTQTLQYDTWTFGGSTTNKSTYRLFHSGSYIESESFDLSKLSKVIVYGGTFGGTSFNKLTIGDGTNTWKSVTVSGSKETGENIYTDGTALSGTGKLIVTSNSGTASNTGVRISKVDIYTLEGGYTYSNYTTKVSTRTLASIAVSGTPEIFWKGDTFNHNGMTVTATWSDNSETVVTDDCTFSGYDMSTAGIQTVTVAYQGKTATYDIEIKTIANTQETAYTTSEAIALIDAGKDLGPKSM